MKFGSYIERDYSNIKCGKVWVSDHAQIDVAVFDPEGNVVFPWVTAWRDYKSGKSEANISFILFQSCKKI